MRQWPQRQRVDEGIPSQVVQRLANGREIGQLFVARGRDEQDVSTGQPATDEGHEPGAHLVGPMDVLENDQQRVAAAQHADDLGDAFEDGPDVGGATRGRLAGFGQEPRELRA